MVRKKAILLALAALLALYALPAPAQEAVTLRVYGKELAGDLDNPLLADENPAISWQDAGSTLLIAQSLLTAEDVDVYAAGYAYEHFAQIAQKGDALDLSAYPAIREAVSSMRAYLLDALMQGDCVYGVPVDLYCLS